MTTLEVGKNLVDFCKRGEHVKAVEALYSPDIVSVEAAEMPGMPAEMKGMDAIRGKNEWWVENHVVHSANCEGPYPNGDQFIVHFSFDVTNKGSQQRMQMDEMGLYTVKNDKIVREEFFYVTG